METKLTKEQEQDLLYFLSEYQPVIHEDKFRPFNNSRSIDLFKNSDCKGFDDGINHIVNTMQSWDGVVYRTKDKGIYFDNTKRIILDLYSQYKQNSLIYLRISKNRNTYSKNQDYVDANLSYCKTQKIIAFLEAYEYIKFYKGYMKFNKENGKLNIDNEKSRTSVIIATNKLINLCQKYKLRLSKISKDTSYIYIRNKEKNKRAISKNRANYKLHNNLSIINRVLRNTDISISDNVLGGNQYLDQTNNQLYRVFNRSKYCFGGRFYGHWVQNLKSEDRSSISISGSPTTELDFNAIHISMLYALSGLSIPKDDPYTLPGYVNERKRIKSLTNIMINCSSKKVAKAAYNKVAIDSNKDILNSKALDNRIKAILNKHENIAHKFFNDEGIKLMRLDSDIAESIILSLLSQNIVVIPIHDSFIVERQHRQKLFDAMQMATYEKLGESLGISQKY